jgi:hypothetical protein
MQRCHRTDSYKNIGVLNAKCVAAQNANRLNVASNSLCFGKKTFKQAFGFRALIHKSTYDSEIVATKIHIEQLIRFWVWAGTQETANAQKRTIQNINLNKTIENTG